LIDNEILNKFSLKNKTVILTGSAGRLGKNFSEILASSGANLVLVDSNEKENNKITSKIKKKYNVELLAITADLSQPSEVKNLVSQTMKKFKKIDTLINNAHFVPRDNPLISCKFDKFPFDLWNETITSNLNNIFLCCKEVGKKMINQKYGSIINISSIYGITGPDQRIYENTKLNSPPFYSAIKGAVVNLTRYLASQWGEKNIRVNTLTLGGVYDKKLHSNSKFVKNYSNKTMLGRMAVPSDYDGALLFLSSDASKYMTGANLIIDGGWTAW